MFELLIVAIIIGLVFGWQAALLVCVGIPAVLLLVYLVHLGGRNE